MRLFYLTRTYIVNNIEGASKKPLTCMTKPMKFYTTVDRNIRYEPRPLFTDGEFLHNVTPQNSGVDTDRVGLSIRRSDGTFGASLKKTETPMDIDDNDDNDANKSGDSTKTMLQDIHDAFNTIKSEESKEDLASSTSASNDTASSSGVGSMNDSISGMELVILCSKAPGSQEED